MNAQISRIVTAILFVIVGVMCIVYPTTISTTLLIVIGISCLTYGIFQGIKFKQTKRKLFLACAMLLVILSIIFFIQPTFLRNMIGIFLGIILIAIGVFTLKDSVNLKDKIKIASIITSCINIGIGLFSIFNPQGLTNVLSIMLGVGFFLIGIKELVIGIKQS